MAVVNAGEAKKTLGVAQIPIFKMFPVLLMFDPTTVFMF